MRWAWALVAFALLWLTASSSEAKAGEQSAKKRASSVEGSRSSNAHGRKDRSGAAARSSAKSRKHSATVPARSVGAPNKGTLVGGKKIARSRELRLIGSLQFALPELVGMLERSADRVAKRHPGSVLTVGDLSRRDGGDVDGHRSHESGRDADVGFYLTKKGKPFLPKRYATIKENGAVVGSPSVRFDDARNWALVESWLSDRSGRVLQIFVARHLRSRLLAHATRAGVSARLRRRAAEVLMQPKKALPHDNHFHVRIACPSKDRGCVNFAKRQKVAEARSKKHQKQRSRRAKASTRSQGRKKARR